MIVQFAVARFQEAGLLLTFIQVTSISETQLRGMKNVNKGLKMEKPHRVSLKGGSRQKFQQFRSHAPRNFRVKLPSPLLELNSQIIRKIVGHFLFELLTTK